MGNQRITQIPIPGNSGDTPTGAMQFKDDWPGLFIRGDYAIGLLSDIKRVGHYVCDDCKGKVFLGNLEEIAKIIEEDVMCRGDDSD